MITAREDLARLSFRKAQSFYRRDYDFVPITLTWETTSEDVREGWRKFADALIAEGYIKAADGAPSETGEANRARIDTMLDEAHARHAERFGDATPNPGSTTR